MSNYLLQYREAIRRGEIVAGVELITELDNLINDLNDPCYIYDTTDAEIRINFMENCIRLTKSPFYGKPAPDLGRFCCTIKNAMKEYAKQFYKSRRWKHCRESFIAERMAIDGGLCQHCHTAPGYIVHHKIHITPQNISNPDITLNLGNLEYVCHECHNKEHFGEGMRVNFDFDGKVIPPDNEKL